MNSVVLDLRQMYQNELMFFRLFFNTQYRLYQNELIFLTHNIDR